MKIVQVAIMSVCSVISLFILTKIMGNKQMSQLSMFDYITGITIGSIAAEMATNLEEFEKPLTAMIVYALLSLLISFANYKSIILRRILSGKALILFEDNKLFEANLKKARIDINEFLMLCRSGGYYNIANLQTAILEPNGKISFLPLAIHRPVSPNDLNITPPEDKPVINIIIDGKIIFGNLRFTGNTEQWLSQHIQIQGINSISDIFLGTCDHENKLSFYLKIPQKMTRDFFV